MATVCAVVVTYNRSDLLSRCLDHLAAQSRSPEHTVVVDNASTDDTSRLLAERDGIEVLTPAEILGSSGGLIRALAHANGLWYDWLWIL